MTRVWRSVHYVILYFCVCLKTKKRIVTLSVQFFPITSKVSPQALVKIKTQTKPRCGVAQHCSVNAGSSPHAPPRLTPSVWH